MIRLAGLGLILALFPSLALADITGKPRVIDGETPEIAVERLRLHGIDAPESEQTCVADGTRWHCGMEAASGLAFKVARGLKLPNGYSKQHCEEQTRAESA